jgi:hypothetical protein
VGIHQERQTREADVEAFFAQPSSRLYLGALVVLVAIFGGGFGLFLLSNVIGAWVLPLGTATIAALIGWARRSPAGRGALWTLSGRWPAPPVVFFWAWIVFTLLAVAVLLVVSLA